MHYVSVADDGTVTELADPTEVPTATIDTSSSDGIVVISDSTNGWAKTVTDYDYVKAMMSNAVFGTQITGMKAGSSTSSGTTTYTLQYTTDETVGEESTWTDIPADAITGSSGNSVDVYLVYREKSLLTVHYVDEDGNELTGVDTVKKSLRRYFSCVKLVSVEIDFGRRTKIIREQNKRTYIGDTEQVMVFCVLFQFYNSRQSSRPG